MTHVFVELSADSQNDDTDERKCIKIPVRFASEEQMEELADLGFDELIESINDWFQDNGHKNWRVDGIIESAEILVDHPEKFFDASNY